MAALAAGLVVAFAGCEAVACLGLMLFLPATWRTTGAGVDVWMELLDCNILELSLGLMRSAIRANDWNLKWKPRGRNVADRMPAQLLRGIIVYIYICKESCIAPRPSAQ